jgi:hypothetical protein
MSNSDNIDMKSETNTMKEEIISHSGGAYGTEVFAGSVDVSRKVSF